MTGAWIKVTFFRASQTGYQPAARLSIVGQLRNSVRRGDEECCFSKGASTSPWTGMQRKTLGIEPNHAAGRDLIKSGSAAIQSLMSARDPPNILAIALREP